MLIQNTLRSFYDHSKDNNDFKMMKDYEDFFKNVNKTLLHLHDVRKYTYELRTPSGHLFVHPMTLNENSEAQDLRVWSIQGTAAVVSLAALLYGTLTWIILPKSRTFHNYVYANCTFTLTLVLWLPFLALLQSFGDKLTYTILFFEFGFLCWLAVASVLIYRDIVIVFASDIQRKILKCNLFAWGVPVASLIGLVNTGISYFALWYSVILCVVLLVQLILYMRVLCNLFRVSDGRRRSGTQCRNIQIATFMLFMGGIPVMLEIAIIQRPLAMALHTATPINLVIAIILQVPTMVYNIFFIFRKSNRCLWHEWCVHRKSVVLSNTVCEINL